MPESCPKAGRENSPRAAKTDSAECRKTEISCTHFNRCQGVWEPHRPGYSRVFRQPADAKLITPQSGIFFQVGILAGGGSTTATPTFDWFQRLSENSPLPLGEGQGVRAWVICSNEKGCIFAYRPHPNPLPEGEGTSEHTFRTASQRWQYNGYPAFKRPTSNKRLQSDLLSGWEGVDSGLLMGRSGAAPWPRGDESLFCIPSVEEQPVSNDAATRRPAATMRDRPMRHEVNTIGLLTFFCFGFFPGVTCLVDPIHS